VLQILDVSQLAMMGPPSVMLPIRLVIRYKSANETPIHDVVRGHISRHVAIVILLVPMMVTVVV